MSDVHRSSIDESSTEALLADLCEEISARVRRGESVDLNDYLQRWPQYTQELTDAFETIRWMAQLKGPSPSSGTESGSLRDGESLGDYSLLREAGRGGMGIVYEAQQKSLKRRVALKVLPFASVLDPLRLKRFENEVQAAALLNHPHIVPIYGVGEDRGIHFFSMKWIDGPSLADVIHRMKSRNSATTTIAEPGTAPTQSSSLTSCASHRTPSYLRSAVQVIADVAEALDHAHRQGIVHRDIKPGNLLMDSRGHVWITDFGLVRMENDATLTATGDLIGTLRYMSPEQAEGARDIIDHRCDIYSLGATFYELLTLQPIFPEESREKLLRNVLTQDPALPRTVESRIPVDLETILIKSLAKRPEDRYATAQAMADDLRCWLQQRPIRAKRPSVADRASKWMLRNHRAVFSGIVAMAMLLITLTVAIAMIWTEQQKTAKALANAEEREKARLLAEEKARGAERNEQRENYRRMLQSLDSFRATNQPQRIAETLHAMKASRTLDAFRGLEWPLLWSKFLNSNYRVFSGHERSIEEIAGSEDGRRFATHHTRSVRVWDSASGEVIAEIRDPDWLFDGIGLLANENELLTFSRQHPPTIRIWDVNTQQIMRELSLNDSASPSAEIYHSQGRIAVGELYGRGHLIDSETMKVEKKTYTHYYPGHPFLKFVWDPSRPRLAALKTKGGFSVADFEREGRHVTPYDGPPLLSGAFVPGKEELIVIDTEGLMTWRGIESGEVYRRLPLTKDKIVSADFDRAAEHCVTVNDRGDFTLWRIEDGELLAVREDENVNLVRWLGNSQRIALAGPSGKVAAWDPFAVPPLNPKGHTAETWSVAYSPDGKWLASGGDDHAVKLTLVSDPTQQRVLSGHDALVAAVAFSPDGEILASASYDGTVRLWKVEDGTCIHTLRDHVRRVNALCFNHDGSRLAAAGDDLIVWDPKQGTLMDRFDAAKRGKIHKVAFAESGRYLVLAISDIRESIEVWDLLQGKMFRQFDTVTECCSMELSADGKMLIAGDALGNVTFFRFPEGEPIATHKPHAGYVRAVRLSHDQTRLFTSGDDRTVMIWDMEDQTPLCVVEAVDSAVYGIDIAPNDSQVAIGCYDGRIHILRADSF